MAFGFDESASTLNPEYWLLKHRREKSRAATHGGITFQEYEWRCGFDTFSVLPKGAVEAVGDRGHEVIEGGLLAGHDHDLGGHPLIELSPVQFFPFRGVNSNAGKVKDMAFHKKRGLTIENMVKSPWVYRKLRNFRAGIEAGISCLKRAYGLGRCTWKGLAHFRAYVWSSVVAHNSALFVRLKPT